MKLKWVVAAFALVSVLAPFPAHADESGCTLDISPSGFIPLGATFSFNVFIAGGFSPLPPNHTFTIVFFGTKNGVTDIPSSGEPYPGTYDFGSHELTGFGNPSSGVASGFYVRYAVIYNSDGSQWCTTNPIPAILQ